MLRQPLVKSLVLAVSIPFFCQIRSFASEKPSHFRSQVFSGLTELGPGIGIRKKIGRRSHLDYSINYLPLQYSYHLEELSITPSARISMKSFGIDFRHYLGKGNVSSGFYGSAGIRLNIFSLSSRISLSDGSYDLGGIQLTCSTCPDVIASIKNKFRVVPGFSIGYSSSFTKKLNFDLSAGIQYFQAPKVGWKAGESEFEIPYFVSDALSNSVNNVNEKISRIFPWIPIFRVSMTYTF